ncbi:MAG: hypothetical protein JO013_10465 [Alphaproteobacteria bacterium]|nr:hypothetical protein [Alphaproteobacteria bacterium]
MTKDNFDTMTAAELKESQAGGGSGRFGGNQDEMQRSGQVGGGTEAADVTSAGGSSGTGGYGSSQDVVNQQDQQARGGADSGLAGGDRSEARGAGISRGERFDEEANGGRGAEDVSPSADELAFAEDQRAHQDRGQSEADDDFNRDAG